jgi:hypothetical protein
MKKIREFIKDWAIEYLRRRNFVVFYLEPMHRQCNDMCWLNLYESEMAKEFDKIDLDLL